MVHLSSYWLKNKWLFTIKNKLFIYQPNIRKLICFLCRKRWTRWNKRWCSYLFKVNFWFRWEIFSTWFLHKQKVAGTSYYKFSAGGRGVVEDLRGKHGLRGKRLWWGIIRILKSLRGGSGKFNRNSTKILGLTKWLVPYDNLGREKKPKLVKWWLHVSS